MLQGVSKKRGIWINRLVCNRIFKIETIKKKIRFKKHNFRLVDLKIKIL